MRRSITQNNGEDIWWAAHVITYIQFLDGKQEVYGVEESIRLVQASEEKVLWEKARHNIYPGVEIGGEVTGRGTCQGRPSVRIFAGIRKIIRIIDPFEAGAEITYSNYIVPDKETLMRVVNDETVMIEYVGYEDIDEYDQD